MDNDFCPKCGAGIESRDEHGMVIRLPRGYPFDAPCDECERRSKERMRELGRRYAAYRDELFWKALIDGEVFVGADGAIIDRVKSYAQPKVP